jgi:hypothetical protein
MKKTQINLVASLLLFSFLFGSVIFLVPGQVAAATKASVVQAKVTKKTKKKKVTFVLKPAPKPTAAEIRAAKQQTIMERSYVSYLKTILPKSKMRTKKVVTKKKVAKKVAKK